MTSQQTSGPAATAVARDASARGWIRAMIPLAVLIVLVGALSATEPSFLRPGSLRAILQISAPLIVLAVGQTFVILTGGIDLSQAVLTSLGTVLIALWIGDLGPLGVFLAIVVITLMGLLNGWVTSFFQVPSFIVTLGAMGLWGAVAMGISGATTVSITSGHEAIGWLKTPVAGVALDALLAIVLAVLAGVLLHKLTRGKVFHAIGLAEPAAMLAGVRTRLVRIMAFGISGITAAVAAVMLTAGQYSGSPRLADSLLLPVIAAVVVGGSAITGGVGGPLRSLVGALVVGVLRVGMGIVGVDPAYEQVVYGATIIIAVAFTLDRKRIGVVK